MKRALTAVLVLLLAACRQLPASDQAPAATATPPAATEAKPDGAAERIAQAEALIRENKLAEAQQVLSPLLGPGPYQDRVASLLSEIGTKLAERRESAPQDKEIAEALKIQERLKAEREVRAKLGVVEDLMKNGRLVEAQEALAPFLGQPVCADEVERLATEINRRRTQQGIEKAQRSASEQAMSELAYGLTYPGSYGHTVVISREPISLEVPSGPMEELVNRKVEMHLQNAGVKELVMALSNIDGLNIIADEALEAEKQLTINVRDVPLKELLSYIARNMGVAFHLGENTVWVTASEEPGTGGPKLETRIYKLRRGLIPGGMTRSGGGGGGGVGGGGGGGAAAAGPDDMELEDALETFLAESPEGASYRIFRNRNLLIVKNSRESLRAIEELIRAFDDRPQQVLIEARFVTISQKDLLEFGFDFPEFSLDGRDRDVKNPIMTMDATSTLPSFANATQGGNLALTGILGNHTYQAVLHAMAQKKDAKTLIAPRVTVVNNQTARIRKGDRMYYFEEYDVQTVDSGDQQGRTNVPVPSGRPAELELGYTLDVKVNIGNDGQTVMLSLNPQIMQFIEWMNFDTTTDDGGDAASPNQPQGRISLPRVNESTLQTTVVVNSGDTVVLGGMLTNTETKDVSKVPWLGDLPLLGVLFRHTTTEKTPEHLLIFVTARIIAPTGDFVQIQNPPPAPAAQ